MKVSMLWTPKRGVSGVATNGSLVSRFVGAGAWGISWWQAVFEILVDLGHQSAVGGDASNDQQKVTCNRQETIRVTYLHTGQL